MTSETYTDIGRKKEKIISLLEASYASRGHDLLKSIELANEALAASRETTDKKLTARSLSQLSLFHMIKGAYEDSSKMAEEALSYYRSLNDEKGIADIKYNLAGIYYKTDNFHLGLVNLIDCLAIYKKYNDYHNEARTQKSLGTIYEYIGDEKNAVNAYEASIAAAQKAGDIGLESNAYNPLSGIYLKQNKAADALAMIEKAIAMKEQSGDTRGLAFSLYGRGKVYTQMRRYAEAEADIKKALEIHIAAGERLGTAMAYRKLGLLYLQMGDIAKAKAAFIEALSVSNKYNVGIIIIKANYHLYEICKQEKDTVGALQYLEAYLKHKEALMNTQTLKVIENYELITRMERMEKEAELQKERAEIIEKKNRAEQAAKVRQDFLATMSHEIRTPLNAVISIISLLNDKNDPEEQQLMESLRFSANNLLRIINDILDFSKLDSGTVKLDPKMCEIRTVVGSLVRTYDSLAKEKGLNLQLNIDSSIAEWYELDDVKLTQIIGNLVSNAIKFTNVGSVEVLLKKINSSENSDVIRFEIKDTGAGIPEKFLDEIFNTFSQLHAVTTRKQEGSGLGLAIVKRLVEMHGSTITVQSTEGKGTTFSFDLYLKKGIRRETELEKKLNLLRDKKVLLAEDNMINAMVAMKLLTKWGVHTEHAKNGREAVEMAMQKSYDFILMDLHMPEMNGLDASRNIKEQETLNKTTPIYALTADVTADQYEGAAVLFKSILIKPIALDKLYDALSV